MNIFIINLFIHLTMFLQDIPQELTTVEIESILGKYYTLVDKSSQEYSNRIAFQTTYSQKDDVTPSSPNVNLYYMYEKYVDANKAMQDLKLLMGSNNNKGFRAINHEGAEGFIKSDNQNYCIVMVAKSNHLIRLKVNKLGHFDQIKQIESVAKAVINRL